MAATCYGLNAHYYRHAVVLGISEADNGEIMSVGPHTHTDR